MRRGGLPSGAVADNLGAMRWLAPLLCALAGGCSSTPSEGTASSATASPRGPAPGPVPRRPDGAALGEVLAAVPSARTPTGVTSSLVGTDTGEPGPPAPIQRSTPRRPDGPTVQLGTVTVDPALSSPAIERAARGQLYWRLRACRRGDGSPPPPDSIVLGFTLRRDGTVDPATVRVEAVQDGLESVVACVLRTFTATPFIGPEAGRDVPTRVLITWPSVD